jgi:hypothetical protein
MLMPIEGEMPVKETRKKNAEAIAKVSRSRPPALNYFSAGFV